MIPQGTRRRWQHQSRVARTPKHGKSSQRFGDWIHLCGPVMRDLSSVASRWWDLTVRQAQVHYAEWKQAAPLQRVQLQPHVPDELQDQRHYCRTEQRGAHLLLKAVASDIQQMRLYVRYQPGGPGGKSLILKDTVVQGDEHG